MDESLVRYPFTSRRPLLLAGNGVVATSQPLAAQAGLRMLLDGGNAVDAALATAITLTVVEPTSNGIGADLFAILWDGDRLHGINGSGRSPAAFDADEVRAAGHESVPERGWASVTVPGAPAAWGDLHARFGRIEWARLFEPAIAYAERGFAVSPVVAGGWREAASVFTDAAGFGDWVNVFAPAGRAPAAGEVWRSPGHAACLRALASEGADIFYRGAIAERIAGHASATGGWLAGEDLDRHRSEWIDPIGIGYRGLTVWELPPNGQGLAALAALGVLDGLDIDAAEPLGEHGCHLRIEAMKLALADAYRYVADPACVAVPTEGLLAPEYLAVRRALIGSRAAMPEPGAPANGGTVYLAAADRDGMMVSLIQSNYAGFGSGIVVPDLGIALQNRGATFTLERGHPNEAAPGKRPRHTIIPGFLTRGGEPVGPFGVMGGEMQPQGHVQVVGALADHDLNPQAALDMPRWRVGEGRSVWVEETFPREVATALEARGHEIAVVARTSSFGRGQMIVRHPSGGYLAGSDWRADGLAVGW